MKKKSIPKEYDFFVLYDKMIADLKAGRRRLPNGSTYRPGTINNYVYVGKNLRGFCLEKKFNLRLRSVKSLTQRELHVEKNYWKKFYTRFSDYMHQTCGAHDNYVGMHMKTIRAFLNYVARDLLIDIGSFYRQLYVYKEEIPVIILTPERLQYLISDLDFEKSLSPRLQKVKDTFVFGCTVALRYSDLMGLTQSNLLWSNGACYLRVRSIKTKTYTQVKLPDYAVHIIKKYHKEYKTLLPCISKFNFNKYSKELIEKAGWVEPIGKQREKRGKLREIKNDGKHYRFCDMISSHTMRRTAITTMLTLGVPEHIVRSISGHAPMSKEFFRYVAIAQVYKDREIDRMHEKLKMLEIRVPKHAEKSEIVLNLG